MLSLTPLPRLVGECYLESADQEVRAHLPTLDETDMHIAKLFVFVLGTHPVALTLVLQNNNRGKQKQQQGWLKTTTTVTGVDKQNRQSNFRVSMV